MAFALVIKVTTNIANICTACLRKVIYFSENSSESYCGICLEVFFYLPFVFPFGHEGKWVWGRGRDIPCDKDKYHLMLTEEQGAMSQNE